MKRVILHIGIPKTGTTALQTFLIRNKAALEKEGIGFYTPQKTTNNRNRFANGSLLISYARLPVLRGEYKENTIYNAEQFLSYAEDYQTLIFSDELIWWNSFFHRDWWKTVKSCLLELCGEKIIIQPIIYLRRQDTWAFSWWKEHLRILDRNHEENFPNYLSWMEEVGAPDYNKCLTQMEDTFGRENIIVRAYEEAPDDTEAIFRDFVSATNLDWRDSFSRSRKEVNPSLSLLTAHALLKIVQGDVPCRLRDDSDKTLLRRACTMFSMAHPDDKPYWPVPLKERKALTERYREGNKIIAERYGGGEDLFSYDIEPYEVLTEDRKRDMKNAEEIVGLTKIPPAAYQWIMKAGIFKNRK